jgi:hypothetical protein
LRVIIEAIRGEEETLDDALVHKVYDLPAVYAVPSEPVRMPGKYAVSSASLDCKKHVIEYRPPWLLGGLRFHKLLYYAYLLSLRILSKLHELGFDREYLPILIVRRLACIDKVSHRAKLLSSNFILKERRLNFSSEGTFRRYLNTAHYQNWRCVLDFVRTIFRGTPGKKFVIASPKGAKQSK